MVPRTIRIQKSSVPIMNSAQWCETFVVVPCDTEVYEEDGRAALGFDSGRGDRVERPGS